MDYKDYHEHDCNITKINYPKNLPTKNNSFGWKHCKCGRGCDKAYTPCIQMFSDIDTNIMIQDRYFSDYNSNNECTFYERICKNGEDIIEVQEKLEEAKKIYDNYFNKTIKCYYNNEKNEIFLDMSLNKTTFITLITIICFTIGLLCTIIQCLIYCCDENYESKKKINSNSKLDNIV